MKSAIAFLALILIITMSGGQSTSAQSYTKIGYTQKGKASYYGKKFHGRLTASGEKFDMYAMTAAHRKIPFGSLVKVTNQANGKWVILRVNDRGPFSGHRILDVSRAAALKLDMIKSGVIDIKLELVGNASQKVGDSGASSKKEEVIKEKTKEKEVVTIEKEYKTDTPFDNTAVVSATDKKINLGKSYGKYDPKKSFVGTGAYNLWGTPRYLSGYGIQIGSYSQLDRAIQRGKQADKKGLKEVYIQVGWASGRRIYRVLYGEFKDKNKARKKISYVERKGYKGAFVKPHFTKK